MKTNEQLLEENKILLQRLDDVSKIMKRLITEPDDLSDVMMYLMKYHMPPIRQKLKKGAIVPIANGEFTVPESGLYEIGNGSIIKLE